MTRQWGARQGAKGYLVKPITEEVLIQAVDQCLAEDDYSINTKPQVPADLLPGHRL